MRPDVPELLAGILQTLSVEVLPDVATSWRQAQLRSALGALQTVAVEWDSAVDDLVRENAELAEACRGIAARAGGFGDESLVALSPSLAAVAALPPLANLRISTLRTRNDELWETMIPVLELIAGQAFEQHWAAEPRHELAPLLRRYVSHRNLRTMPRR
jgi:hypothetical protein